MQNVTREGDGNFMVAGSGQVNRVNGSVECDRLSERTCWRVGKKVGCEVVWESRTSEYKGT